MRLTKSRWVPLLLAPLLAAGAVGAETYTVDPVHSSVDFSIRHMVGRIKGRFNKFSGTVVYDPAKPEAAKFSGAIEAGSIDTGNERRDNHLRSADFFDVETHPTVVFESTKVEKTGEGKLAVSGTLTMRGVTKEVLLEVEVLGMGTNAMTSKPQVGFSTGLTVKRSDFGVNHWSDSGGVLSDEVKVEVLIEANAG